MDFQGTIAALAPTEKTQDSVRADAPETKALSQKIHPPGNIITGRSIGWGEQARDLPGQLRGYPFVGIDREGPVAGAAFESKLFLRSKTVQLPGKHVGPTRAA